MSDIMRPIKFEDLMMWILSEYKSKKSIFGLKTIHPIDENKNIELFGSRIENPIGPAAGPHTQLAQNIITAYCAGSRFFELKTVQQLDGEDLNVSKPCINAKDECYNVEWSTELKVKEAMEEYIKAWFALKLISKEFSFGEKDGFIFNMSVGYDLDGIKSKKIDSFIENLKDASNTQIWNECMDWSTNNIDKFENITKEDIKETTPKISSSITLSTLHGCPPDEIEKIASYLIEEKKMNVYVKCNPTLLGYKYTRKTLDRLGYTYMSFDEHHFNNDMQLNDAIPMIERLKNKAKENGLRFGVKLTNTFPVMIKNNELPGEEMYMSGRSLYPLTIKLAYKLAKTFDGDINISFSGGADYHNIKDICNTGIYPITFATTLLKTGGYARINQMADQIKGTIAPAKIDVNKLKNLSENLFEDKYYKKNIKEFITRKISKKVPKTDCFIAPCSEGCPIDQDIPQYIRLAEQGKYLKSLKVITDKNPLPFITGTICNHRCMSKCTRIFYEQAVNIREIKLKSAQEGYDQLIENLEKPEKRSDNKVAVVGGGVAGIAVSYFCRRNGLEVTVFEKENSLGGTVKNIIPEFRISNESIEKDIQLSKAMGVEFKTGHEIKNLLELKDQGYKYIVLALGASKAIDLDIKGDRSLSAIHLLKDINNKTANLEGNIATVGGGGTAMDVARAVKKLKGVQNSYVIYRRDLSSMPAQEEEIEMAIEDKVEIKTLLSPIEFKDGNLKCAKMKLGEKDESGRRKPVQTDETITLKVDALISAIGEKVDVEEFERLGIKIENKNIQLDKDLKTNLEDVYVIGDSHAGPATIVEAIKDADIVAKNITKKENLECHKNIDEILNKNTDEIYNKKGKLSESCGDIEKESGRCLECSSICEACVDVCPNRANISVNTKEIGNQIIHIESMCNECGNCEMFCPYSSAPYKEKLTLFTDQEEFVESENQGMLIKDGKLIDKRIDDDTDIEAIVDAIVSECGYILC